MSTLTLHHGAAGPVLEAPRGGSLSPVRRLIEARQDQAKRTVAAYLAQCSDERLRGLGLAEHDIQAIRSGTFQGVRT